MPKLPLTSTSTLNPSQSILIHFMTVHDANESNEALRSGPCHHEWMCKEDLHSANLVGSESCCGVQLLPLVSTSTIDSAIDSSSLPQSSFLWRSIANLGTSLQNTTLAIQLVRKALAHSFGVAENESLAATVSHILKRDG